ncbi:hypothetical protein METBIDRAFT_44390 [Metschnikowia bicuspidata var. bicuspidata NRRL YB-4993]|uniref:DUF202 domain-containing protein n=1 Tax=Metschnikowia bicuspidata var. bicuspidata NRRL YB-4993 TaxID=869754 RepID=A0A1A0H9L6_9ASCO|nr:hypothetical protein METBIDRAFT_44390 [Metschnikowia bicuspidata var. bicuspidata NRRL YB-4993]OBA20706.1 hypothetical protein METBIDRAFT_44390 [Metschnikowia bicuspidata var. bicuspidata NRRL YB-4993]
MSIQRRTSRLDHLASSVRQDVRAHQRTYKGAYTRTAIQCLSFSVMIIKFFSAEFLPIGTVYTAYGFVLYFVGVAKARNVWTYYDGHEDQERFTTAGDSVLLLTLVSLATYVALFVLVLRL